MEDRACFVRDGEGRLQRVLGAMRDISKRKLAEEERERFVRILEATTDVVGMTLPDGEVIHLNAAGRKLAGLAAARIRTPSLISARRIRSGRMRSFSTKPFRRRSPTARGAARRRCSRAKVGRLPSCRCSSRTQSPDGEAGVSLHDHARHQRAEAQEVARMEEANRYDAAIRASGQVLFDWNSFNNDIAYAGDVERLLGYSDARRWPAGCAAFAALVHVDDLPAFDQEVARVNATRDPFRLTCRMLRKDGREIVIDAKGFFFLDRQGNFGRMVGFLADITGKAARPARAHPGARKPRAARRRAHRGTGRAPRRSSRFAPVSRRLSRTSGSERWLARSVSAIFREASAIVHEMLRVDFCSVLQLTPDKRELVAVGGAGWPDEASYNRVPVGRVSQSGYTLLTQEPVIAEDLATETRFRVSDAMRSVGARSAVSVIIQAGDEPIGVLCAITGEAAEVHPGRRAFSPVRRQRPHRRDHAAAR